MDISVASEAMAKMRAGGRMAADLAIARDRTRGGASLTNSCTGNVSTTTRAEEHNRTRLLDLACFINKLLFRHGASSEKELHLFVGEDLSVLERDAFNGFHTR